MDAPEWVGHARAVESAIVEVGFVVADAFYYGSDNGFSPQQWRELRDPLYQPQVARYGHYVLTRALDPSAAELAKHYADVVRLSRKHGKDLIDLTHHFWLSPLVFAADAFEITFPWYDTWEESERFLADLGTTGHGEIFSDLEQGWEVAIYATPDRLFFRQGNFDTGEEQECVSCDRRLLTEQIPVLRQRALVVFRELRAALGRDFWSRR